MLSLRVPEEFLPSTGAAKFAYREAFLNVVSRWAIDQKVNVIIHGLQQRTKADLGSDDVDEAQLAGKITLNEITYIQELNNPYLFPMPMEHDGTDLISTAEKFIVESKSNNNLNVAAAGSVASDVDTPDIVTLIPGHSWNHIGADAHKESKTAAQRMLHVSPLIAYLFNFATNPVIRAMMLAKLGFN